MMSAWSPNTSTGIAYSNDCHLYIKVTLLKFTTNKVNRGHIYQQPGYSSSISFTKERVKVVTTLRIRDRLLNFVEYMS